MEPELFFAFSHDSASDSPWGFEGGNEEARDKNGWMEILPATSLVVFTGGGILGSLPSNFNSYVNAIRTTYVEPPWHPGWNGQDDGASFLRGTTHRIGLNNTSTITDSTVYYNIYIRLQTDCSTFHVFPVLSFRYLYC